MSTGEGVTPEEQLQHICESCSEEMGKAIINIEEWKILVEAEMRHLAEMIFSERKRRQVAEDFIFSKELGNEYVKYLNTRWTTTN